jgi:hypothetical protein
MVSGSRNGWVVCVISIPPLADVDRYVMSVSNLHFFQKEKETNAVNCSPRVKKGQDVW